MWFDYSYTLLSTGGADSLVVYVVHSTSNRREQTSSLIVYKYVRFRLERGFKDIGVILGIGLFFLTVSLVLLGLPFTWVTRASEDSESAAVFECGFEPNMFCRVPFSVRFFLVAVLFLVFDVEVILLLPGL